MSVRYYLGIDCGTSGTKTVLLNHKGEVVESAYMGYELEKPGKYMVEQSVDVWWEAIVNTVRSCCKYINKNDVKAMAISSQAGCVIPVKAGKPIGKSISWLDSRAGDIVQRYVDKGWNDCVYMKTGWKISPGMVFPKIIWYKENKPDIYENAEKFLTTIDYLNYMLTGEYVIDPGNASLTQAYNVVDNCWDEEILSLIGFNKKKLPHIVNSCREIAGLTGYAAEQLGLSRDTIVYSGGHDQYCVATGAGVFNPGEMLAATGTAWVNLAITEEPVFDTENYLTPGRHVMENTWGLLSSIPTAGASMEWFNDRFGGKIEREGILIREEFSLIDNVCRERMNRDSDVLFYPGQTNSNEKRASFIGLGLEHDRYDLFLAIMECVSFEVLLKVLAFERMCGKIDVLTMTGGAAKSDVWKTVLSSVLNREVISIKNSDIAAIGAAVIASYGFGEQNDLKQSSKSVKVERRSVLPHHDIKNKYKEKFNRYLEFRKFCTM